MAFSAFSFLQREYRPGKGGIFAIELSLYYAVCALQADHQGVKICSRDQVAQELLNCPIKE